MSARFPLLILLPLLLGLNLVQAQERWERRSHERPDPVLRWDLRDHYNRFYPPRGEVWPVLPAGAIGIVLGADRFYFQSGVWFRPQGERFVVVAPPVGVVVPVLPSTAVMLNQGGITYYYANGVYYTAAASGYAVSLPPGAVTERTAPAPDTPASAARPDPVIYPRNGQGPAQTEADRQACNRWATTQPAALAHGEVFVRMAAACMDGRGYTVR